MKRAILICLMMALLMSNVVYGERLIGSDLKLHLNMNSAISDTNELTKSEALNYVVRMFEVINRQEVSINSTLEINDTTDAYVLKGATIGLVKANAEGNVEPNEVIIRRDFSVMLMNALLAGQTSVQLNEGVDYSVDLAYDDWSNEAMAFADTRKIIVSVNDYVGEENTISDKWVLNVTTRVLDELYRKEWSYNNKTHQIEYVRPVYPPDLDWEYSSGYSETLDDWVYGIWSKKNNDFVLPLNYKNLLRYGDNLYKAKLDGKYGVIDKKENVIIPIQYDGILEPPNFRGVEHEALADDSPYEFYHLWLEKDKKFGLSDYMGNLILPAVYDKVVYAEDNHYLVFKDGKISFIDKKQKLLKTLNYDDVVYVKEGRFKVKKNNKYGLIDKMGKEIAPIIFDEIANYNKGLILIKKDDKYGLLDTSGAFIAEAKYDSKFAFNDSIALVESKGKVGFIDRAGNEVVKLEYDKISNMSDGRILGYKKEVAYALGVDEILAYTGDSIAEMHSIDLNILENKDILKVLETHGTFSGEIPGHFAINESGFRYYPNKDTNSTKHADITIYFLSGDRVEISIIDYNEKNEAIATDFLLEAFKNNEDFKEVIDKIFTDIRSLKALNNRGEVVYPVSRLHGKIVEVNDYTIKYDHQSYFNIKISY